MSVVRYSPIFLSNLTHIGYVNILMGANLLLTFFKTIYSQQVYRYLKKSLTNNKLKKDEFF